MARLQKIRKDWGEGKFEHILKLEGKEKKKVLRYKSVNVCARGRKRIDSTTRTEETLIEWIEEGWKLEQRVSRTSIFRKVLDIDPKFCGGVKEDGYLGRMKKLFYYGFVKSFDLSNHKMSGAGQKFPTN